MSTPVMPPSGEPFLRFYHSQELRIKTLALLTVLEQASRPDAIATR